MYANCLGSRRALADKPLQLILGGRVVSKEEKMFIVEMVRDGKITSEQAVQLLNALERSPEQLEIPSDEVRLEEDLVEEKVEQKVQKMGETIEAIAEDLATKTENVFFRGLRRRPKFIYADEFCGQFPEHGEIEVTLYSMDGAIEVKTWEKDHYRLEVIKKVNTVSEEEAQKILEGCVEFKQEGLSLAATAKSRGTLRSRNITVDFILTLPTSRKARLDLRSGDGSVAIHGVSGSLCKAATGDGSLGVGNSDFGILEIGTGDGSIVLQGISADECRARTGDGSIKVFESKVKMLDANTGDGSIVIERLSGDVTAKTMDGSINADFIGTGNWLLKTKDGSIAVRIHGLKTDLYEVDLSTRDGRIDVEGMEDADIILDQRGAAHVVRRYKAVSRGFAQADSRGSLKAGTGSGSVAVRFLRG